jgi:DNA primase
MGQYFTKEVLRRLRNEVLISEIIQVLDIPSKTRDGYLRFLCPLCNEFMTACHPKTNLGRCFRCQRNFNPIDLVMVVKGLCFQEDVGVLLASEESAREGGKDAE